MGEPESAASEPAVPVPEPTAPEPAAPAVRRDQRRETRRETHRYSSALAGTAWQPWLAYFVFTGMGTGILWWLLAPGGAFYGDGNDFKMWFPRDAVLAGLMVVAGAASAVVALRGQFLPRRGKNQGTNPSRALFAVLVLGGFLASVIAWRTGVFAGDLFQTPPANMPSPSVVFSLRSPSVLVLWPLASSVVVFAGKFMDYYSRPGPTLETMQGSSPPTG